MQNEFEKQVQQKMEDLKLVPSEPVWQKVEMQIRKKKDRRRLLFWIPLVVLLLGGTLWFGIDQYSNNVAYNRNDNEKINSQNSNSNAIVSSEKPITEQKSNKSHEQKFEATLPVQKENKQHSIVTTNEKSKSTKLITQKKNTESINQKEIVIQKQSETPPIERDETLSKEKQVKQPKTFSEQVDEQQKMDQKQNADPDLANTPSNGNDSLITNEAGIETDVSKIDSIQSDSAPIKLPLVKNHTDSKWKLAFGVSAGISGTGRLNVFNGFLSENKVMDYLSGPVSGGPQNGGIYFPPSEVKKGLSFSLNASLKKQLTRRSSFSTGLQYNYYSNSVSVGNSVSLNTTIRNYAVTQFFSNYGGNFGNVSMQPYRNHFHFLSLPLTIEWQLLKKRPLNLNTGLSLQYLVQTNGLVFDYNNQAYFHNETAFNRLQFFSNLGLNYSFKLSRTSIALGPDIQYGVTRLEKDNSNHHLYMYGLKAQLQLR